MRGALAMVHTARGRVAAHCTHLRRVNECSTVGSSADAGCRMPDSHVASGIWHLASSMGSLRSTPKCVNDLVHDWRMEKNSSGIRHPPSPKVPKATIDWCRGGRGGGHRMVDARGTTWSFLWKPIRVTRVST